MKYNELSLKIICSELSNSTKYLYLENVINTDTYLVLLKSLLIVIYFYT